MPGTNRSGRRPKPLDLHVLQGTYRADRHGPQPEPDASDFDINKPSDLPEAAAALFDELLPVLRPIMRPSDVTQFLAMCEVFGLYRQCLVLSRSDATDKEARIGTLAYLSAFNRIAAGFGMTPSDRARVRAEPGQRPLDPYEQYLQGKLATSTSRVATRNRHDESRPA